MPLDALIPYQESKLSTPEIERWVSYFSSITTNEELKKIMKKCKATHLGLFPTISFQDPKRINHFLHAELTYDYYSRLSLRIYETGKNAIHIPGDYGFDKQWSRNPRNTIWKEFVSYGSRPVIGNVPDVEIAKVLVSIGAKLPTVDETISYWENDCGQGKLR